MEYFSKTFVMKNLRLAGHPYSAGSVVQFMSVVLWTMEVLSMKSLSLARVAWSSMAALRGCLQNWPEYHLDQHWTVRGYCCWLPCTKKHPNQATQHSKRQVDTQTRKERIVYSIQISIGLTCVTETYTWASACSASQAGDVPIRQESRIKSMLTNDR